VTERETVTEREGESDRERERAKTSKTRGDYTSYVSEPIKTKYVFKILSVDSIME
jgi:hypothetical protein